MMNTRGLVELIVLNIGLDLGMTHAQTIGVIATTEQSAGRG